MLCPVDVQAQCKLPAAIRHMPVSSKRYPSQSVERPVTHCITHVTSTDRSNVRNELICWKERKGGMSTECGYDTGIHWREKERCQAYNI